MKIKDSKFIKAQISSVISTMADFGITFFLTSCVGCWYLLSSVIGSLSGGYTNFSLGRLWVFKAAEDDKKKQAFRYVLVWLSSILLNTAGVFLFTDILKLYYMISKVIVAVCVGIFFNYYLQHTFVFSHHE